MIKEGVFFVEISRKEKFNGKKKTARKLPKLVLVAIFVLGFGTTSAFAASSSLADLLYSKIMGYIFADEIEKELDQEKKTLVNQIKSDVKSILSESKEVLDHNKDAIIEAEKEELREHYDDELKEVTKKQQKAINDTTKEMKDTADQLSNHDKDAITEGFEAELEHSNINKK
jgi:ElaB/YqjD/DUF883 family membrane-anchored ribosome-binding protein